SFRDIARFEHVVASRNEKARPALNRPVAPPLPSVATPAARCFLHSVPETRNAQSSVANNATKAAKASGGQHARRTDWLRMMMSQAHRQNAVAAVAVHA